MADVRWVQERGLLEGHSIPLRKEEYHYSVTVSERWTGGNRGLVWLRDVPRLEVLRIEDAPGIDDKGLALIGRLPTVEELYMRRVRTTDTDTGLDFLRCMPNLRRLCIHNMEIRHDAFTVLAELKNLESLNLGSLKQVDGRAIVLLKGLPRLRVLILARTGVSDCCLQHLGRNLESLNLFETEVTDDGMKSLQKLRNLKHLNLTGTHVSDKGLAQLVRLENLESIYVGRSEVTPAGVAAFLKASESRGRVEVVH